MRTQVEKVINAIRPAIQADEGDIELIEVDETSGVVTVELFGACVTCPVSTQTLKAGIERIMKGPGCGCDRGCRKKRSGYERIPGDALAASGASACGPLVCSGKVAGVVDQSEV